MGYGFIPPKSGRPNATARSAIGITSWQTLSCVVPTNGPIDYVVTELRRFALDAGWVEGTLQSGQEPAITELVNSAAAELGMGVHMTPVNYTQSQGSVE